MRVIAAICILRSIELGTEVSTHLVFGVGVEVSKSKEYSTHSEVRFVRVVVYKP